MSSSSSSTVAAVSAQQQRNAEIWSTRVQRELLALTTETSPEPASTHEIQAMLPPFCNLQSHVLDINTGTCTVSFRIEIVTKDVSERIVIQLDPSLPKKADGSIDHNVAAYPFQEPIATLQQGQDSFPHGSTIRDGDRIAVDLDWTPSLHLADAVLNIALKIKESILQGEPFHPLPTAARAKSSRLVSSMAKAGSSLQKVLSPVALRKPTTATRKQVNNSNNNNIRIGDEINLTVEPWVDAHGVYSCKAIRRPPFLEQVLAQAHEEQQQQAMSSPTAMFRSFTQSARSVLEESYLMITETHIIEMRASKLNMSSGKVTLAIPVEMLAKLKFRRGESVSLFFKPAPEDPLVYVCPDAGDAVHQIQSVLKRYGVKGKHTNAAAHRAIQEALQLVQEIQTKELALKHDPTVQRVNEIMDLYRQAAERFEIAGDIRHEEVVTHMRKFLALPLTTSILDGSYTRPVQSRSVAENKSQQSTAPQGEVLEQPQALLEDDDDTDWVMKEKENDKVFEENIDNLLKEAQEDVKKFTLNDLDATDVDDRALADVAADLDAMMAKADQEIEELMKS